MNPVLKAAAIRAARTAAQTFIGVIIAKWMGGAITVTALYDTTLAQADFAGGSAISAALVALGVNAWKPVHPETVKPAV